MGLTLGVKEISADVLDNHTMGELEDVIWEWLNEDYGVFQGDFSYRKLKLEIALVRED